MQHKPAETKHLRIIDDATLPQIREQRNNQRDNNDDDRSMNEHNHSKFMLDTKKAPGRWNVDGPMFSHKQRLSVTTFYEHFNLRMHQTRNKQTNKADSSPSENSYLGPVRSCTG